MIGYIIQRISVISSDYTIFVQAKIIFAQHIICYRVKKKNVNREQKKYFFRLHLIFSHICVKGWMNNMHSVMLNIS